MTFSARLFLIVSLLSVSALPGMAQARTFLLQLGSFESSQDAQARWSTLQAKYPEMFAGLSVRLLDVTLPPDDFTVYRTQAGVLDSREDAQAICSKLNEHSDECYVVETAMFDAQSFAAPVATAAQPDAFAPVSLPQSEPLPELEVAQANPMPQILTPQAGLAAQAAAPAVQTPPPPSVIAEPSLETEMQQMQVQEPPQVITPASIQLPPPPPAPVQQAALQGELQPGQGLEPVSVEQPSHQNPPALMQPQQVYAPASAAAYQPLPANTPFQVKRDGQPFAVNAQAALPAANTDFVPVAGGVSVAEAVPVPVSTRLRRVGPRPYPLQQLRSLGLPSVPGSPEKRIWAEIKYFRSQQEALAFWNAFRAQNPAFPPSRVRLTTPYLRAAANARPRIALRVGPFQYDDAVTAICAQVRGEESQCRAVRDLGASASAQRARLRTQQQRMARDYRSPARGAKQSMYWVQLGGYQSPQAAYADWNALQQRFAPTLSDASASVVLPTNSSALSSNYRLRAGPYGMRPLADQVCDELKARGGRCAVIFGQ